MKRRRWPRRPEISAPARLHELWDRNVDHVIDPLSAESVAERLLSKALPRRWAHTKGVGARARSLAPLLGHCAPLVEAAAWLHDIGYAPSVARVGFHPLDGARFLRAETDADDMVCRLVAHHSGAEIEAEERRLPAVATEFDIPPDPLLESLIYCDMTAGVDGQPVEVEDRLTEILTRYPGDHVVHRSITRSAPMLRAATHSTAVRLHQALSSLQINRGAVPISPRGSAQSAVASTCPSVS